MELFIFLANLGVALSVRLTRGRRWMAWVVWFWVALLGFLALVFMEKLSGESSLLIVAGGSIVGLLVPEIWDIIRGVGRKSRNAVVRFLGRPRNLAIVLFLLFFLYALKYQPELLGGLMAIAIMVFALLFIARPLWKGLFKSK